MPLQQAKILLYACRRTTFKFLLLPVWIPYLLMRWFYGYLVLLGKRKKQAGRTTKEKEETEKSDEMRRDSSSDVLRKMIN